MERIREKVRLAAQSAAAAAMQAGALPEGPLPEGDIQRPQNPEHGDYSSNLAMKLARQARMNPLEIAERIANAMPTLDEVAGASAVRPGFINFKLAEGWLTRQVETVLEEGEGYADSAAGAGRKAQVEFVSVNPTGPVHVGHARGAVLGSTLANVLAAAGFDVVREYYVNDAGSQMDNFYASLYARAAQSLGLDAPLPADGYAGDYVTDAARRILEDAPDREALEGLIRDGDSREAAQRLGEAGLPLMLDLIRTDLEALGVEFDVWFSERSLFEPENGGASRYEASMGALREGGYLAEREGATWFTSTSLGEDKDNVVVRSNGTPTYFASDIAYHRDKFGARGFERVIDIWGADHQGHTPRMKAAMAALGFDPESLVFVLAQLVTLKRGGETIKISKRSGDLITLREVVDEVGRDVCRFYLLSRSADSQMDFDLEAAKRQSQDNPVYYVQYAHARIASILRLAEERGISYADGDVSLLTHEAELALIRKMLGLPELVDQIAASLEPHHLPHYSQELATAFHHFYKHCRVVSNDTALTAARLKLVKAAQISLARALGLMGMSAPDTM